MVKKVVKKRVAKKKTTGNGGEITPEITQNQPPVSQKIATTEEWEATTQKTKTVTLPSGLSVKIKTIDLMDLVVLGHLEMPTLNEVSNFEKDAKDSVTKHAGKSEDERDQAVGADVLKSKNLKDYYNFCCDAVILSCIEPIVTKDGANGTVCIDNIRSNDKMFIGSLALGSEDENAFKRFF